MSCKPKTGETFAQWFGRQGFKYFKANELEWYFSKVRNGVSNKAPARSLWPNIVPTLRVLDRLREEVGKPINISSTYRDKPYNRAIGSGDGSQHVKFTAVDFTVSGMTPGQVFNKLKAMRTRGEWVGGLGKYRTFVHIDTRKNNATW
jgi:uncharacterized protein YcbK (DUF882 family)